ncbi:MAG: Gfo/Idh/MocA family oxidoreductase [Armatimonadota bacterium]
MDKVNVGVAGAGWMGSVMLRRLSERDDVNILALYEANSERGKAVLKELGLSTDLLVDSFDAIIENPDIDAVWLVSPNSFHAKQSIAAMNAGKHVFSEKPCATAFDDYCKLIDAEKSHPNLVTFVDYILNFDSMETWLKGKIAEGEFGDITQIQVNYRHPINIAGDKAWKLNKEIMGDAIGMGINHSISVMVNLMSSQGTPAAVYATSAKSRLRPFEADPIWNIMVEFSNSATGFCFGNIDNSNGYDAYHNIFGTAGGFIFDAQLDQVNKVRYWSEKSTSSKWIYPLDQERCNSEGFTHLVWPEDTTTPDTGNVVEHQTSECVGHFIECVKSGKKSSLSFINSAAVAEIGWAAQMSAATGKKISLPLDMNMAKKFFGEF